MVERFERRKALLLFADEDGGGDFAPLCKPRFCKGVKCEEDNELAGSAAVAGPTVLAEKAGSSHCFDGAAAAPAVIGADLQTPHVPAARSATSLRPDLAGSGQDTTNCLADEIGLLLDMREAAVSEVLHGAAVGAQRLTLAPICRAAPFRC